VILSLTTIKKNFRKPADVARLKQGGISFIWGVGMNSVNNVPSSETNLKTFA
jgi:hypothetical protein